MSPLRQPRADAQGGDGIRMVQELQTLLEHHAPDSMVLAASFKTPRSAGLLTGRLPCDTLPFSVSNKCSIRLR